MGRGRRRCRWGGRQGSPRPASAGGVRGPAWAAAGLCALALPLVVLVAGGSWALPGNASEPGRLADAVTRWLPSRGDVVSVDYLPTVSPSLLGVTASGAGFVNELDRRDVRLQPPGRRDLGFGPVLKHATGPPAWTVLLGVRNDSPPPPPGFREIAYTETLASTRARRGIADEGHP